MQNIRVRRVNGNAIVEPDDKSWRLVVEPDRDPKLWIAVEVPKNEEDEPGPDVEMMQGYMPAIYGDPELLEAVTNGDMEAVIEAMGCPDGEA